MSTDNKDGFRLTPSSGLNSHPAIVTDEHVVALNDVRKKLWVGGAEGLGWGLLATAVGIALGKNLKQLPKFWKGKHTMFATFSTCATIVYHLPVPTC
jgi:hypothetical protein